MNQLQQFNFNGNEVRTAIKNGEPWWVAKDVCEIIGLEQVSRAMDRLDVDEKGLVKVTHPQNPEKTLEVNAVNESGLYQLIIASNKPEARVFRKWVTSEVLPTIRKTGAYNVPSMSPAEVIAAIANQHVEQERRMNVLESRVQQTEQRQEHITEILSLNPIEWRQKVTTLLNRIAQARGGDYEGVRKESYKLLEERARCDLSIRQTNKKKKMALEGVARSRIDKVSKLDAIAEDARLTEVYLAIVKELAIRHNVEAA